MFKQSTQTILMVRPATASSNPETIGTNSFQSASTPENALSLIQDEFDNAVLALQSFGVDVTVIQDTVEPITPDAMFPNNWFSTSQNTLYLYPMLAENRRNEVKPQPLQFLKNRYSDVIDLRHLPPLEGTGALVLDHLNQHAFVARSPRANLVTLTEWAAQNGYSFSKFSTSDTNGMPVYHTNVMMAIGTAWAVIATECIVDSESRLVVYERLEDREIIDITYDQMLAFAGNMIELVSSNGDKLIVMSQTALESLSEDQISKLSKHGKLVAISIPTIEQIGGGSIRCMIAELF